MKSVRLFDFDRCVDTSPKDGKILLIGDSHSNSLAPGFRDVFWEKGISQIGASRCRPLVLSRGDSTCMELMNIAVEKLIKSGTFDTVIIAARWRQSDIKEILNNLDQISRYVQQVVIIGPIVEYRQALPRLLAFNFLDDPKGVKKWSKIKEKRALDSAMKAALADKKGIRYISIIDTMCDGSQCVYLSGDGRPIQKDYGHLTDAGAIDVVRKFKLLGYLEGL